MPATATLGAMVERLVIQENDPNTITLTSLTRTGSTATATTPVAHGYTTGDYVTMAGSTIAGYNGKVKITVTSTTTFTYAVSSLLTTPATGSITTIYASDAQGGRSTAFANYVTVWAEMMSIGAMERLQAKAISAQTGYRFRIYTRTDLTPKMRAVWTPTWPPHAPAHTLEIHGIVPFGDGRTFSVLECGEDQ